MLAKRLLSFWLMIILSFSIGLSQNSDSLKASGLMKKAEVFFQSDNWDSAAMYFDLSGNAWQLLQTSEKDTTSLYNYFSCREKQAISFYNLSDFQKSDSLFQQLIPEMKKTGKSQLYKLGKVMLNSGRAARRNNQTEYEIAILKEALALDKTFLNDSLRVKVLSNLGATYLDIRDYENGIAYYLQALPISKKYNGSSTFDITRELARAYYDIGDMAEALGYYKELLPTLKAENDPAYGKYVSFVGVLHKHLGEYNLAISYALKALPILQAAGQEEDYAYCLLDLGLVYDILGDRPKALDCFFKALPIFESYGNEYSLASCYMNLGIVCFHMENLDLAFEYYHKALSIFRKEKDQKLVAALFGLGELSSDAGNLEKALSYMQEGLTIATDISPFKDPGVSYYHLAIAKVYAKLNRNDEALKALNKATDLVKPYPDHPARRLLLYELGLFFDKGRDYKEALSYYQDLLDLLLPDYKSDDPFIHPSFQTEPIEKLICIVALDEKAKTLRHASNGDVAYLMAADTCYQIALHFIEQIRQSYRNEDSKLEMQKNAREFYVRAFENCIDLYKQTGQEAYLNRALSISEKSKTAALFEALQSMRARQFSSIPSEILISESKMRVSINRLEEIIFDLEMSEGKSDSSQLANYRTELFFQQQKYDSLLLTLDEDYPDYYQLKYQSQRISSSLIQSQLKENEAFISYFLTDSLLHGFVFSQNEMSYFSHPKTSRFDSDLRKYREMLTSSEIELEQFYSTSHDLYQIILQPSEHIIRDKKIVISPDGILNTIPFESLLTKSVEIGQNVIPYLIKDHGITYTYSATFFVSDQKSSSTSQKVMAFAPSFNQELIVEGTSENSMIASRTRGDTLRGKLSNLNGTVREVEQLQKILSTQTFIGDEATESSFKALSEDFGLLHLATHAIINQENPLNSYLIFTADEDSTEDNNLYAWELYNMQLNAQMAVLSACNTGFGKLQRGEGVMSLGRAFAYAGVPSIVMSLWPAEDESTADLMGYFYKGLSEGMAKNEALQAAKIKFLEESAPDKRHPFYWAGFVVQGDAGPLEKGGFPVWGWVLIGGILLGLGTVFTRLISKRTSKS